MYEKELEAMLEAARLASENIMKYYRNGFDVEIKEDNSPVTEADKTSDVLIRRYLSDKFPTYSFLTEEEEDDLSRLNNDFIFIIDPLDGTKDFIKKDDEFTVNIALCFKHKIVAGVVAEPARGNYYYASLGKGAYKLDNLGKTTKLHVSDKLKDLTCLVSIFHESEEEKELIAKNSDKITKVERKGSSLKACEIASGLAEVSFRCSGGTKERDTGAFQIIVEEAGGLVLKPDKTPITYNREDVYNREGYIIINRIENFML